MLYLKALKLSCRGTGGLFPRCLDMGCLRHLAIDDEPYRFPTSVPTCEAAGCRFSADPVGQVLARGCNSRSVSVIFRGYVDFNLDLVSIMRRFAGMYPGEVVLVPGLGRVRLVGPPVFANSISVHGLGRIVRGRRVFLPSGVDLSRCIRLFLDGGALGGDPRVDSGLILIRGVSSCFLRGCILDAGLTKR